MGNDASDSLKTVLKEVPTAGLFCIALLIFFAWAAFIGFVGWQYTSSAELEPLIRFVVLASLAGAAGGLVQGIRNCWTFNSRVWNHMRNTACGIDADCSRIGSPVNNLLFKPLLWPVPGAMLGLVLALIFLDQGTYPLKIALLGAIGGLLWERVHKSLPGMFKVAEGD